MSKRNDPRRAFANSLIDSDQKSIDPGTIALAETIESYDRLSSVYAARFAGADLATHRVRFEEGLAKGSSVLDAGCGSGRDCHRFECSGFRPLGLDLSRGLLREAQRTTCAPLVVGDVRSMPFVDGSFQGIWCCAVLLHLDAADALLALKEMKRVLVNGGALFVCVREGTGHGWRNDTDGHRRWFQLYSLSEMTALVESAGFAKVDATVEPGVVSQGTWINLHASRP